MEKQNAPHEFGTFNVRQKEVNKAQFNAANYLIGELQSASASTRSALSYILIACIIILISVFNSYFSWMRHINYKDRPGFIFEKSLTLDYKVPVDEKEKIVASSDLSKYKDDWTMVLWYPSDSMSKKIEIIKSKVDSMYYSYYSACQKDFNNVDDLLYKRLLDSYSLKIPLVGIDTNSSDILLIGNFCIFLLILWFYFKAVREGSITFDIMKIVKKIYLSHMPYEKKYEQISFITKAVIGNFLIVTDSGNYFYERNVREINEAVVAENKKILRSEVVRLFYIVLGWINNWGFFIGFLFVFIIGTLIVLVVTDLYSSIQNDVFIFYINEHVTRFWLSCIFILLSVVVLGMTVIVFRGTKKTQDELFEYERVLKSLPRFIEVNNAIYEEAVSQFEEYRYVAEMINVKLRNLSSQPSKKLKVLEIGAGTGKFSSFAFKEVENIDITLVEPDFSYIEDLILKFPDSSHSIIYTDFKRFESDKKYDVILSSLVWHHIPDSDKAEFLEFQMKKLKPDGRIFIFDVFLPDPFINDPKKSIYNIDGISIKQGIYEEILTKFHQKRLDIMKGNHQLYLVEKIAYYEGKNRLTEFKITLEQAKKYFSIAKIDHTSKVKFSRIIDDSNFKVKGKKANLDLGYYLIEVTV